MTPLAVQTDLFPVAMPAPAMPKDIIRRSKGDADYRWWLTREWGFGPQICWIMLNPSMADHVREDPTLHRIIGFSRSWGFGRLAVVNLYPFRSSSPAECKRWADWQNNGPDWCARDAMQANLDIVCDYARSSKLVIAAWGAAPWASEWADHVAETVQEVEPFPRFHCLGRTADGSPKHPLARGYHRVPDDQRPLPWGQS